MDALPTSAAREGRKMGTATAGAGMPLLYALFHP
jgi:hypothetical protein